MQLLNRLSYLLCTVVHVETKALASGTLSSCWVEVSAKTYLEIENTRALRYAEPGLSK
jgi:hypothetical protein